MKMKSDERGPVCMERIYENALACFDAKEDFVLVTILARRGSAPRGVGAKMLVRGDGTIAGSIGGGSVEYKAGQIAQEMLAHSDIELDDIASDGEEAHEGCRDYTDVQKKGFRLVREFDLGATEAAELGMVCGGRVTLEFYRMDGTDAQAKKEMESAYRRYLNEIPKVYIFGGGHVAQATVPILTSVGFRCVVADDRPEFADARLFPQAEGVYQIDFRRIEEKIQIHPRDYVIIMTRGHEYDYEVQAHALSKKPFYIGVMGSRHKIAFVTKRLLADGFSLEEIEKCHMPIGLAIKAETPEEIAISIAGELIQLRAEKTGSKR